MRFDVLTLFPDLFSGYVSQAILSRAISAGLVSVHTWDFRQFAKGVHKSVDDRPYGGGPGMVLMCEPIFAAVEDVAAKDDRPYELIMLTPAGERLNQKLVHELSQKQRLVLLCGRYEGFDDRIRQGLKPREISIGDFVCNGGEVPAMVLIDTVIRLIPGVLGDEQSTKEESHSEQGLLEYPQFTRPREFRGMKVPDILFGGNHAEIARWRRQQAIERTQERNKTQRADNPSLDP